MVKGRWKTNLKTPISARRDWARVRSPKSMATARNLRREREAAVLREQMHREGRRYGQRSRCSATREEGEKETDQAWVYNRWTEKSGKKAVKVGYCWR